MCGVEGHEQLVEAPAHALDDVVRHGRNCTNWVHTQLTELGGRSRVRPAKATSVRLGMRALEYSRDGRRLGIATADHVHLVDLATATTRSVPRPQLRAFALIGDELWSVGGDPPMLEVDGHAERLALPGTAGRLVRGDGPHAVWNADAGVARLVRTATGVDVQLLPDVELALPLGTRLVACTRGTIQLRADGATRWSSAPVRGGRAIDGAAVFDGRALALHLERGVGDGVIVVLDARNGTVQHRLDVCGATAVRFASRRGIAVVAIGGRELVVVDLRFGRILGKHALARDVIDLAVDDAGQRVALRHGDDPSDVVELELDDVTRGAADEDAADVTLVAPHAMVETEPPPVAAAPIADVPCALPAIPALPPRLVPHAPSAGDARALFETSRGLVVALCSHAIARAWDEGRAVPDGRAATRDILEGANGSVHGLATADRIAAAARLDDAFGAWWRAVRAAAPAVAPLHELADEYGLTTLEQLVLLVVAAPALWGELARLYGILANDPARAVCDELLVTDMLATVAGPAAIAAVLEPTARLVRHGLVRAGAGVHRPFLALTADPVVLRVLRGGPRDAGELVVRAATCTFAELRLPGEVKRRLVEDLARASAPLRVVVRGRRGSGRHTVLATIAAATGRQLGIVDAAELVGTAERVDALELALQRVALAGLVPCIDGLDAAALHGVRDRVCAAIARYPGPVMVRMHADVQPPLPPGYVAIDVPAQTLGERAATWSDALERAGIAAGDADELAARFALGPGTIARVVAQLAGDPGPRPSGRLEAAIRQHLDGELGTIATRVERLPTWSHVILPPDIQDSVTELIARIRHRRTVFDTWGFDRVMSTSRGLTAMFQGGPGTGKTLVACAIANELGLDVFRVDVSRIMSKWIGETEANLARLFDAAHDGNAILLFDEADSLFAKRTEVKSSNDRFANVEVNYLLQRLDAFEGIAILTTNFGTAIDPAINRRLSFRLTFPFPDEDQRERLWRAHLPAQLPVRGELPLAELARKFQLSGGYIRNCALRAAFLAVEQGGTLTADHLERAIRAEFRELGKLSDSGILE